MASLDFDQLYEATESGVAVAVPEGTYDVQVTAARPAPKEESRTVFLDLQILNGPAAGKTASVALYFPEATNGKALFHFRKKIAGFMSESLKQAMTLAASQATFLDGLTLIASALEGTTLSAEIGIQSGGGNSYDGSNELKSTGAFRGGAAAPAPAAPAATPAPVAPPVAQPAPVAVPAPPAPVAAPAPVPVPGPLDGAVAPAPVAPAPVQPEPAAAPAAAVPF